MTKIKIGTRRSKLALIQSEFVERAVREKFPDAETEFVYITTKGDKILDKPLEKIGGKGVFISEIENALISGEIDIAVHSAKDLPVEIKTGTEIFAVLSRACPNDVLVTRHGEILPEKCIIGTSSKRRAEGVRKIYPLAETADIRGNVDTRLNKLEEGLYDGIVLAEAGLSRLGALSDKRFDFKRLEKEILVPAPCQGIIAIQGRSGGNTDFLSVINDTDTYRCFETERHVLEILDSGCSSPTGAVSFTDNDTITLTVTKDQKTVLTDSAPVEERFNLAERLISRL